MKQLLFRISEAAQILSVSQSYLRDLVSRDEIQHIKLGRAVRFTQNQLDDAIDQYADFAKEAALYDRVIPVFEKYLPTVNGTAYRNILGDYIDNRVHARDFGQANRLPYGLAAYAYTRSTATAARLSREVETGMLGINNSFVNMPETPFGGVKQSGYGSEGGIEGMEPYLVTKTISLS